MATESAEEQTGGGEEITQAVVAEEVKIEEVSPPASKHAEEAPKMTKPTEQDGKDKEDAAPESEPALDEKKGKKEKGKGKEKGIKAEPGKKEEEKPILKLSPSQKLEEDEWTWESYTPSTESIVIEVKKGKKDKEAAGKKEKKGKGEKEEVQGAAGLPPEGEEKKKDKKGKGKVKEEVVEAPPDAANDVMAEIKRMKAMADAQAAAPAPDAAAEEAPSKKGKKGKKGEDSEQTDATEGATEKKEDKGPKQKLSKQEKARLAAELAEQARIQAEIDAKLAEEAERIRIIEERKAAKEKEKRESAEQILRTEQLNSIANMFKSIRKRNVEKDLLDKAVQEWEQFLKCDGLPDPYVCGQLNTYLHLWNEMLPSTTIEDAAARTTEALHIRRIFCKYQQENLDRASYRLLRGIQKNMNRINLATADFLRKEEIFVLYLWLNVKLPTAMPNPRNPAPPQIHTDVPAMKVNVLFPLSIECNCQAIRIMYVMYDHLSNLSESYHKPPVPAQLHKSLNEVTLEEWQSKLYYKFEKRPPKVANTETGEIEPEEVYVVDRAAGIIPIVPYTKLDPTASEYVINIEDKLYAEIRQSLETIVEAKVINLRKYSILGGVYFLDLYYQPPQPQEIVSYEITVARFIIPKRMEEVSFHKRYDTPPPPDPLAIREPQEIEDEIRKQDLLLSQLMLVTLTLPSHIMWFDIPLVCYWDRDKKVWTQEEVHDMKHVEEAGYITFRTGRFGCFGLAAYRYSNLPFQAWEMKPEANGTITLQITAAILLIDFNIKSDRICIVQCQNAPNKSLKKIIGIYYRLPKLVRIMQDLGIDIFPAPDSFCYITGTCEKHWPVEKHTYHIVAMLSTCYNFMWSRWNITAGRRNLVMQMREYKPNKPTQVPYNMVLVTPLKATYINCTEVSQVFLDESVEGMFFYSDLYQLMKGTCGMATRTKVQNAPFDLIGTVTQVLIATRIMSYS